MKKPNLSRFREVAIAQSGNVSGVARAFGVQRRTIYDWMQAEKEFRAIMEGERDALVDLAESTLKKNIANGDVASTIFCLKTLGRNRGYTERTDIDIKSDNRPIPFITAIKIIHANKEGEPLELPVK